MGGRWRRHCRAVPDDRAAPARRPGEGQPLGQQLDRSARHDVFGCWRALSNDVRGRHCYDHCMSRLTTPARRHARARRHRPAPPRSPVAICSVGGSPGNCPCPRSVPCRPAIRQSPGGQPCGHHLRPVRRRLAQRRLRRVQPRPTARAAVTGRPAPQRCRASLRRAALAASARVRPSSAPAMACIRAAAARPFSRRTGRTGSAAGGCMRIARSRVPIASSPGGSDTTRITSARIASPQVRVSRNAGRHHLLAFRRRVFRVGWLSGTACGFSKEI
jgi:hypothetical protein